MSQIVCLSVSGRGVSVSGRGVSVSQIVGLSVSDSVVTDTPQAVTVSVSDTDSAETLTLAEHISDSESESLSH